jgi:hypothetical protein
MLFLFLLILCACVESAIQKVLPGSSFTITYTIQFNSNKELLLNHTSDGYTNRNVTIDFLKGYKPLTGNQKKEYFANDPGLTLYQKSKVGNTYTFSGIFKAPLLEGTLWPYYTLQKVGSTENLLGYQLNDTIIKITCSDGIFCNGAEKLIRGICKRPKIPACQSISNSSCTSYPCDEALKRCGTVPIGNCSSLPSCDSSGNTCQPDCVDKLCGPDGCGGFCGSCPTANWCVDGECDPAPPVGSCAIPKSLLNTTIIPLTGVHDVFVYGDIGDGVDMVDPICGGSGIVEYVYKFTISEQNTNGMGFEIRSTCEDGNNTCDTILAVHNENCEPFELTSVDRLCTDDETPPGNVGSRVDGKLHPGNYTLVITAWSPEEVGPYRLQIKFTPGCYPKCDDKFCGGDDCGGTCGYCGNGTTCFLGKCVSNPCIPNCKKRQCGPDGCGGDCGGCKTSSMCDDKVGKCIPIKKCNNFVPKCSNMKQGMGANKFCGSDCKWHKLNTASPDLIPNSFGEMNTSIHFLWNEFEDVSCALNEGCVRGTGRRLLMNFATIVHNIGSGDLIAPKISRHPDLFTWASCHQHYHYQDFARFSLYNISTGNLILLGAKQAFCMVDDEQYFSGPSIGCEGAFDCTRQGILRGRSDVYASELDCQWLDITDIVKVGCWHTYQVCTNIGQTIFESDYENNCISFPIYIPKINSSMVSILSYADGIALDNAHSFYPGCKL